MFHSLLAVFWFSTSSSIASLRFNGGGGVFAFVIFSSSLSTIFHCRCSEPTSIVVRVRGFLGRWTTLMYSALCTAANYRRPRNSKRCRVLRCVIIEIADEVMNAQKRPSEQLVAHNESN